MALNGSTSENVTPEGHVRLVFAWSAEQNKESLTSTVSWELQLVADASGEIIGTDVAGSPWSVTVDGEEFSGTSSVIIGPSEAKVLASGQKVLTHAADGTKSFDYEFSQYFGVSWGDTQISYITGSGIGELDTISNSEENPEEPPEENPDDQEPETPVIKSFEITTNLQIDLAERGQKETLSMVQGDISSRAVEITLTANGVPWEPEGATGTVIYRRADGTGGSYDTGPDDQPACSIDGNIVTARIAPEVLAVPGEALVTVALSAGGKTIHTFVFSIDVQRNPGYKTAPVQPGGWTLSGKTTIVTYDPETETVDLSSAEIIALLSNGYCILKVPDRITTYAPLYSVAGEAVTFNETIVVDGVAYNYLYTVEGNACTIKRQTVQGGSGGGGESTVTSWSLAVEAQRYTLALSLADGSTETHIIETDANNYPVKLTVNGVEIPGTVTGV